MSITNMMKTNKSLLFLSLILSMGLIMSCSEDDGPIPDDGDEEEEITQVVLTFTPTEEGDAVTATWFDVDGADGTENPTIDEIDLVEGTEYTLTMVLTNTLASPSEDITEEITAEDDEHMFFFAFTENIFADPAGNGNVDNRSDAVNYNDMDENGLPVGLSTTWTAGEHTETSGEFTIVLKHQPDLKTATSDANVGGSDLNITLPLNIVEDPNVEEEEINKIVLTFTPTGGGDAITATHFDGDGADGAAIAVVDDIDLAPNTEYMMSITLTNTLGVEDEDVTEEIEGEDDEHMFFFEFTADIFSDPAGNGNADNRSDALNYNDQDENGLPVGLSTTWTTGVSTSATGVFGIKLRHQPGGLKTATSDATVGGADLDIEFDININ